MKKLQFTCLALCLAIAFAGCGGSKSDETAKNDGTANDTKTTQPDTKPQAVTPNGDDLVSPVQQQKEKPKTKLAADASPTDVVKRFLTALRDAQKDEIGALLTDTAWVKIGENQLIVGNSGIPSAQFQIGKPKLNPGGKQGLCHVPSVLMEKLDNGESEKYEATWVLRKQRDGWRIAGMASPLESGGKPVFLNFEKPDLIVKILNGEVDSGSGGPQTASGAKNTKTR